MAFYLFLAIKITFLFNLILSIYPLFEFNLIVFTYPLKIKKNLMGKLKKNKNKCAK